MTSISMDPRPVLLVGPSGRFRFRSPVVADAPAISAMDTNPANSIHQEHICKEDNSISAVETRIKKDLSPDAIPKSLKLVVEDIQTHEYIGRCGYSDFRPGAEDTEAGLTLESAFVGKGIGTECVQVMLELGFCSREEGGLGFERIKVSTHPENGPMRAVMEKKFRLRGVEGVDVWGTHVAYWLDKEQWTGHFMRQELMAGIRYHD